MSKEEIEEIVIDLINQQLPKIKRILTEKESRYKGNQGTEETYFYTDLAFDSLKTVELFMECEEIFGITFGDDEIMKTDTIEKLINKIQEKIKQQ